VPDVANRGIGSAACSPQNHVRLGLGRREDGERLIYREYAAECRTPRSMLPKTDRYASDVAFNVLMGRLLHAIEPRFVNRYVTDIN